MRSQQFNAIDRWQNLRSEAARIETLSSSTPKSRDAAIRSRLEDLVRLPRQELCDLLPVAKKDRAAVTAEEDSSFGAMQLLCEAAFQAGILKVVRDSEQEAVWAKIKEDLADVDAGRKKYDDLDLRPARPLPFHEIPGAH